MNAPMKKAESAAVTSLHPEPSTGDTLSVLRSPNIAMAKTWLKDGEIRSYNNAKYFTLEQVQVKNIHEQSKLLKKLESHPNACLIRGSYVGGDLARKRTPPSEYKEGYVLRRIGIFEDQPLHAVMIEVDNFELLFPDLSCDPLSCIREYILSKLPPVFRRRSFHWQLSNSAGHPDKLGLLKVHLWFWLSKPHTSAELKAWAKNINLNADRSVFNPVQIHYTSKPIFEKGLTDPIPVRNGFFQGSKGEVDLEIDHVLPADCPATVDKIPQKAEQHDELGRICVLKDVNNETIKDLESALKGMKPEHADDYKSWINVLEALASLKETPFSDEAHALAHEFSQRCPEKYDSEYLDRTWEGLNPIRITYRSIFKCAQKDGWINPRSSQSVIKTGQILDKICSLDSLPDIKNKTGFYPKPCFEFPPGIAGDIAKYIYKSSRLPVNSYAIAGALIVIAHLNNNRAYVKKTNTALNLYQCIVGDTGRGKEDPRRAIKRLLDEANGLLQKAKIYESIASGPALLRSLEDKPNALILFDEFGIYLQNTLSDKGPIHQKELIKELMILYGTGCSYYSGKSYANPSQNIDRIDNPYINLLGTTTPLELLDGITVKTIDNGFLNRILFIQANEENPINREPDIDIDEDLKQKMNTILDIFGDQEQVGLEYEENAHDLLVQLTDQMDCKGQFANLWSRAEEQTIRVAGLLALGDGNVIKVDHINWAWSYIKNCIEAFAQKLDKGLSENPFQKQVVKAIDYISNASNYSGDQKFGKYCKKGYMPKGKLTKLLKIKSREVDEVITYLMDTKQIKQLNLDGVTCFSVL